jgi:two-component system alkaline phosphatase synthesis response regulator PhoP
MSKERLLVVEDEEVIRVLLEDDLSMEGYDVATAGNGETALSMAGNQAYDLIILDVMLPGKDGFQVCRELRESGVGTPILMLTAKSQEIDKVLGLELGADDYVTKPFSPKELVARIRAILRRRAAPPENTERYHFGDVEVDFKKFETRRRGEPLDLTAREYSLLRFLIENRDRAVDRFEILEEIWGEEADVFPRTVDSHIANLRKKIEEDPASPRHIVGVRSVGYRFAD